MKRDAGPNALRRGRDSCPGASYFITACVAHREPALRGLTADAILRALRAPEKDKIWRLRCGTVMPDHIHCLFELGNVYSLSRALGRFKAFTKATLGTRKEAWQENFYDHRLRPNESAEPVFRYIFMNPYEAGLIQAGETWPWFYCCPDDWAWFSGLTDSGQPYPEWLM